MATFLRALYWMGGVCLLLLLALPVQSGQKFLGAKKNLVKEAVIRSNQEQSEIKKKMIQEIDKRIESWEQRSPSSIKLKVDGSYSFVTEVGSDHSGLNTLRSHVELEPTDIDFEDEFREVNSVE